MENKYIILIIIHTELEKKHHKHTQYTEIKFYKTA